MTTDGNGKISGRETADGQPASTPAERALAEAEERRGHAAADGGLAPKELGGREGPEPMRYGDWEKGGIASDF